MWGGECKIIWAGWALFPKLEISRGQQCRINQYKSSKRWDFRCGDTGHKPVKPTLHRRRFPPPLPFNKLLSASSFWFRTTFSRRDRGFPRSPACMRHFSLPGPPPAVLVPWRRRMLAWLSSSPEVLGKTLGTASLCPKVTGAPYNKKPCFLSSFPLFI